MPEEEGENKADTDAHHPGHDHAHQHSKVGHGAKHGGEFGHGAQLLGKDFGLLQPFFRRLFRLFGLVLITHVVHGHVILTSWGTRVSEGDLRSHHQGQKHEAGKDGKADVVVSLALIHVAFGVLEDLGMVEDHAHDEHGEGPADGAEHAQAAVLVLLFFAQQCADGGVGHSNSGRTEIAFI